jgi:hypothetical protein
MDVRIGVPVKWTLHVEPYPSGCGNFMWLVAVSAAEHIGMPVAFQVAPVHLMWLLQELHCCIDWNTDSSVCYSVST